MLKKVLNFYKVLRHFYFYETILLEPEDFLPAPNGFNITNNQTTSVTFSWKVRIYTKLAKTLYQICLSMCTRRQCFLRGVVFLNVK